MQRRSGRGWRLITGGLRREVSEAAVVVAAAGSPSRTRSRNPAETLGVMGRSKRYRLGNGLELDEVD